MTSTCNDTGWNVGSNENEIEVELTHFMKVHLYGAPAADDSAESDESSESGFDTQSH